MDELLRIDLESLADIDKALQAYDAEMNEIFSEFLRELLYSLPNIGRWADGDYKGFVDSLVAHIAVYDDVSEMVRFIREKIQWKQESVAHLHSME